MLPLGLWYLHGQRAFWQERCFTMAFPLPLGQDSLLDAITRRPILNEPDFRFSGGLDDALSYLTEFRNELEALAAARDTLRIIHVRFGHDATYGTVVHALESCRLHTDQWMLDWPDLVTRFYRRPPPSPSHIQTIYVDDLLGDDVIRQRASLTPFGWVRMKIIDPLTAAYHPIWPAIPLYFMLAFLGLRKAFQGQGSLPQ